MSPPVVAYVGLGSNLGDSIGLLVGAIRALGGLPGTSVAACSGFYRTPAWGITDQPDFINAVAELHTALAPHALLHSRWCHWPRSRRMPPFPVAGGCARPSPRWRAGTSKR